MEAGVAGSWLGGCGSLGLWLFGSLSILVFKSLGLWVFDSNHELYYGLKLNRIHRRLIDCYMFSPILISLEYRKYKYKHKYI